jgi:DNA-binding NtrC family response regulator
VSNVLIIEPDVALRDRWAEALGRNAHDVQQVSGIAEAMKLVREGGHDAIVVDAGEAELRELVAELERVPDSPPLILVSDSPRAPELSAQIGAAGFLPKPCTGEDLVEVVARVASAVVRSTRTFDDETTSPREKDF